MLTINPNWLTLILTIMIPVATALVTKASASTRTKAAVTIVLAAVVTLIGKSRMDNGPAIISAQAAYDWLISTVVAVGSYLGAWKPLVDVNAKAAPGVGIG